MTIRQLVIDMVRSSEKNKLSHFETILSHQLQFNYEAMLFSKFMSKTNCYFGYNLVAANYTKLFYDKV